MDSLRYRESRESSEKQITWGSIYIREDLLVELGNSPKKGSLYVPIDYRNLLSNMRGKDP